MEASSPEVSSNAGRLDRFRDAFGGVATGGFVWRDEFKSFFDFLVRKQADAEALGFRPAPAGEWVWDENEIPSPDEASLIFEALESFCGSPWVPQNQPDVNGASERSTSMGTPDLSKKRSRLDFDPELQDRLEQSAIEYRKSRKRSPPKKTLANDIAAEVGLSAATVMRRTRRPGTPRK